MNQLVIFDLDGVLLDSEKIYMDMNQKFFGELGAPISLEEHQTFVGISATQMWTLIKERFNLSQTVEELKELEKELKYKTLDEMELTPSAGVVEFLDRLKSDGYLLTIASSGLQKNIELILRKLKLRSYFEFIVSGEEVIKGKPEPDIFLKVSDHFKRKPNNCIVFEDSTNGVKAAKSAGMVCFGYFNPTSGKQDLNQANFIFDSFKDPVLYQRMGF